MRSSPQNVNDMSLSWPFIFILALFLQVVGAPQPAGELLDPEEKAKIEKEKNVEGRIKVYEAASKRMLKTLETAVDQEDFQSVPENLKLWTSLLLKSLEDIESNLKTKKKSRALIKYEIEVRKAIANTESYKIRAPVEQQEVFDSCLAQAEKVRKRLVEILFQP